jgi:deoxyribodipyrimidine photolyase-related protein
MESFYCSMRKRYDILMEKDKPFGGQWNHDQKNRQVFDRRVPIPKPLSFENDVTPLCQTLKNLNCL